MPEKTPSPLTPLPLSTGGEGNRITPLAPRRAPSPNPALRGSRSGAIGTPRVPVAATGPRVAQLVPAERCGHSVELMPHLEPGRAGQREDFDIAGPVDLALDWVALFEDRMKVTAPEAEGE